MSLVLRHLQRQLHFTRQVSSLKPEPSNLKWDLVSAVCLERKPLVTPPLTDFEKSMVSMLKEKEFEESMFNDHEMRHRQDLERAERKKRGDVDLEVDNTNLVTAHDVEDAWKKDAEDFTAAPRLTEADKKNDVRSTQRKLDETLRLLVKVKIGDEEHWRIPRTVRRDGESMRQAADRAVKEKCGDKVKVNILGNAPWSFYKFKYPKKYQEQEERVGAKVFVFKGYLTNDKPVELKNDPSLVDFQWATLDEMEENLGGHRVGRKTLNAMEVMIPDRV